MYVNSTSTDTFLTYPVIWFLVLLGLIQPEKILFLQNGNPFKFKLHNT